ncbi:SLC16A13 [Branchiostoma lanceolatum]|uniref:SLC16A13 protein n=1 Tax=Branchiostoma lanceolatum TaxID=7740 RepID=A0A8K0E3P2_BRALA|nr:SLC16A13 [Branchiostoma lanceolatum]
MSRTSMKTMAVGKRTNRDPVDPPDGGWGWAVVLAGFMVLACTFGVIRSLGVFFLPWREQFPEATAGEIALVQSILSAMTSLAAPVASALGRRFGFRPVIMAGGVIAAGGFSLSWFTTQLFHLYITIGCIADQYATVATLLGLTMLFMPLATSYGSMATYSVVFGLFSGAIIPLMLTATAELVVADRLPSAFGITMFLQGAGGLVGPPVSGALRDATGSFDATFLFGGACAAVGGLVPFLLHMRVFSKHKTRSAIGTSSSDHSSEKGVQESYVYVIIRETSL